MKRSVSVVLAVLILIMSLGISVSAAPTDSYTHSDKPGNSYLAQNTRNMYEVTAELKASSFGLEEAFKGLTDICVGPDGCVYILCGEESRLVRLNKDYSYKDEISVTDSEDAKVTFTGALGVFVDKSNNIYISDTSGGRIIITDSSGRIIETKGVPQSDIIPKEFIYQPVSVAIDDDGYTYILSLGCYYGALVFSPEEEFIGFYGSNSVNAGALDTIAFIWDKLTGTDAKRAQTIKELPYSFVDFAIDSDGYMVVCNISEKESSSSVGQIRKIGPTGSDILYKRQADGETIASGSVGFAEGNGFIRNGGFIKQNFNSIDIDDNGFIYALDGTYGLIYVYDSECHLMNVFAGGYKKGIQSGVFKKPIALAVNGDDILVADQDKEAVTVFRVNDYGRLLKKADSMYISGDYSDAAPLFEQVLSMDRGNQLAYRGLAMNSYLEGDYKTALQYAENGLDYSVYDLAFQATASKFISDNFVILAFAAIIVISGLSVLFVKLKKRNTVIIKSTAVKALFATPFHPFNAFADIKYKKQGSVAIAVILTFLLYAVTVLKNIASGFLYTTVSLDSYNMLYTLMQTVGLLLLWSVSNWLISSLLGGNGTFKEVYIASSYSLLLLIICEAVRVVVSHFMPLSGAGLMSGIQTVVIIFTAFLLCIAISTIHEFTFFKFLSTTVLTVAFMLLVVFIIMMFSTLIYQVVELLIDLYTEIFYR